MDYSKAMQEMDWGHSEILQLNSERNNEQIWEALRNPQKNPMDEDLSTEPISKGFTLSLRKIINEIRIFISKSSINYSLVPFTFCNLGLLDPAS